MIEGIGLAISSTTIALQLMREKGMNRNKGCPLGFSMRLFQDIAAILPLALILILARANGVSDAWVKIKLIVAAFDGIMLSSVCYCCYCFVISLAASGLRKIFTATLLLVE